MGYNIVLDTNVVVAGLRSRTGASFRLLSLVGTGRFDISLSVPLVLEYEEVLLRESHALHLEAGEIQDVIDYFCSVGKQQEIFFLWRPKLPDPNDDLVLEVAVAAGANTVVTFNVRDFVGVEEFGIQAMTPHAFLRKIGESK